MSLEKIKNIQNENMNTKNKHGIWWGRITAAVIGCFIFSLAISVFTSIYLPTRSGLESGFAAGLLFPIFYMFSIFYILKSQNGWRAWKHIILAIIVLAIFDAVALIF